MARTWFKNKENESAVKHVISHCGLPSKWTSSRSSLPQNILINSDKTHLWGSLALLGWADRKGGSLSGQGRVYDSLQSIPCHPNEGGDLHEWDPGPSLHLYFYLPPRKAALVISNVLKSKVSLPNFSSHHFLSVNVWRINWCESTQWKRNKMIYIPMLKKMNFFCQTPLTSFLVCWKFISESQDDCSPHSEWTGELSAPLSPLSTC